jgi:hypothetical protein
MTQWPRIRSYVLRPDGKVVFSLTCSHERVADLHDAEKAKRPEWFLGKRWPCEVTNCKGELPDAPLGDVA